MIGEQFIKTWLQIPANLKNACERDSPYVVHSDFFKFFCCYLAFNHLYDCNKGRHTPCKPFLQITREGEYWKKLTDYEKKHWKPFDREKILAFVDRAVRKIKQKCNSKPEWTGFISRINSLLLKPVIDSHYKDIDKRKSHTIGNGMEYNDDEHELIGDVAKTFEKTTDEGHLLRLKLQMVFLRIYQVRCNLFHGGKNPNKQRDIDLVTVAADVLETFLWFVVRDCHGEIW